MTNLEKESVNTQPLVSIAIITYNQKEYLRECLESCLAQDYPNFEIVVADDCSTDGTQEMLREYAKQHPDKFVLKLAEKNQGITPNSNVAHFACSGKYIAWMGGDDLMLPGKLSKQVAYMEKNPECTICYHNLEVFDDSNNKTIYLRASKIKPRQGTIKETLKYACFNGACSTMVRAKKTPKHGFMSTVPVASDWLYWVETLANGGTINYIDEVLGRYRRHENNVTKVQSYVTQNELDHLVSCQIILAKYPQYASEAYFIYGNRLLGLRYKLPYFNTVLKSFLINYRFKTLVRLGLFVTTFGFIKK